MERDDDEIMSSELAHLSINHQPPPDPGYYVDAFEQEPPPPHSITSDGIVAVDITQKFLSAATKLEPGELVKDGFFTLFASVGALEIMDPKMDSGCLAPGESLDEDYDVTRPLLPSEVIGIIDQLLSLEMAWHLGYPLSQTLFTSVYIEKMLNPAPGALEEADFLRHRPSGAPRDPMLRVLRAYCLGLVKACSFVNERIKKEHYFEEEDFVTNTYHRPLLEGISAYDIRDEIDTAERDVQGPERAEALTDDIADALSSRLKLRTSFLRAIELSELRSNARFASQAWSKMQGIWENINRTRHLGTPVPEAFSTKIQRRLASTMPPRPIVQPSAEETHEHFKKLITDGINVPNIFDYFDSQCLLNFVLTFMAQKPQPLVYTRALLQHFVFQDMVVLGSISIRQVIDDDLSIVVLPGSILLDPANDDVEAPQHPRYQMAHHMELFRQRAAQSYLDIFRTLSQNRSRVRRTLYHMVQDWETVQIDAEQIDQLLQGCTQEQPLVYPPGSNSVPSHSLPLSSWAYHYKLRLMEWTVQLGFELDIYQPDELAGMYWYLSYLCTTHVQHIERIKFFTQQRLAAQAASPATSDEEADLLAAQADRSHAFLHLASLSATTTASLAEALSCLYTVLSRLGLLVPTKSASTTSTTTTTTPPTTSSPSTSSSSITSTITSTTTSSSTTSTTSSSSTTTTTPHLLPPQEAHPFPYSTPTLRYTLRMRPFTPAGLPPLPSYETFSHAVARPEQSTLFLLESAARAAATARKGLEALASLDEEGAFVVGGSTKERWGEEVRRWMRAGIAVGVGVMTVQRWLKRGADKGRLRVEVGGGGMKTEAKGAEGGKVGGGGGGGGGQNGGYHEWWVVPRVVEEKV